MAEEPIASAEAPPNPEPSGIPYSRDRDRNTPWIVFGALLATLGGLGAFLVATNLADRVEVVVAAREVSAGEPLAADDLTTVEIGGGDGAQAVAGDRIPELVGSVPRSDLAPGTIIHPDQIIDASELTEGTVVLGTKMTPGQYPLPGLLAGQVVRMIGVSGETSFDDDEGGSVVLGEATIVAVGELSQPDDLLVSLRMAERLAPLISERAQQGRLRVVVIDDPEELATEELDNAEPSPNAGP